MAGFRLLLIVAWLALAAYTALVIANHGWGLFPIFFGDIADVTWRGQFNADFLCFLLLSAIWTAWRNGFSAGGLLLGAIAFVGGAGFLLPYLLILFARTRGDVTAVLTGRRRA
jgi:hypothetical protein